MQQVSSSMSQKGVSLHLPKADPTTELSSLDWLVCEGVGGPSRPHLSPAKHKVIGQYQHMTRGVRCEVRAANVGAKQDIRQTNCQAPLVQHIVLCDLVSHQHMTLTIQGLSGVCR